MTLPARPTPTPPHASTPPIAGGVSSLKAAAHPGYNLSITQKVWLSVSILLVGYAGSTALGFMQGKRTSDEMLLVSEGMFPAAMTSQLALSSFREQINQYSDAVEMGIPEGIATGNTRGEDAKRALQRLIGELPADSKDVLRARAEGIRRDLTDFGRKAQTIYPELADGKEYPALFTGALELARDYERIDLELVGLKEDLARELQTSASSVALQTQHQQYVNLLVFLVVASSALILVQQLIRRSITRPLKATVAFAQTMASGDLSQKLDIRQKDEIGDLAVAINEMAAEIEKSHTGLEDKVRDRTAELRIAHKELMLAAHQAGMADVASAVLHNVGNILNSVSVTTSLLLSRNEGSKTVNLGKAADLLQQHAEDLASFLGDDPKGKKLVPYVVKVSEHLNGERETEGKMLRSLQEHIRHITDIIDRQQANARQKGVHEDVDLRELVEYCVETVTSGSSVLFAIETEVEEGLGTVRLDRHKSIQILVNLLNNAKQAMKEAESSSNLIKIRVCEIEPNKIAITVEDNGSGIAAEDLGKLFSHGFTTKKDGHGFGLHSACLAAQEMHGELTGSSSGPDCGASFTLELPVTRVENEHA